MTAFDLEGNTFVAEVKTMRFMIHELIIVK